MEILCIFFLAFAMTMAVDEVALKEFTSGNNLFTAAVYREVSKENQGNFLVSPFSAETVLALTQSGAKDETAYEIRSGLRLPNSTEKIQSIYADLLPTLKGSDKYALKTANRVYVRNDYNLKDDFLKVATDVFQAGVENVDFSLKEQAADNINQWVEKQTEEKIKNLIDPKVLGSDTRVVLVNALYFKGKWANPFESFATGKRDFYVNAKDAVQVDTMATTELFNYYESEELNAKYLELPYLGGDVSMVIVLPNERDGLAALESKIDSVFTTPNFSLQRVRVSLPKFTIETKINFKNTLKNLGVTAAFDGEKADFSGIAGKKGDLYISEVVQKTFINVTESGTEAAAATAVVETDRIGTGDFFQVNKEFIADHPVLFYIVFKQSTVLFAGRFVGL